MVRTENEARRAVLGGALAGLTAGVLLSIIMTVMSAAAGKDVWYGMKGAAAPIVGARAMEPGFDLPAVALGVTNHLAISLAWGVLFALAFYGLSRGVTMLAGIGWGVVVWFVMYYVVLPIVGLAAMRDDAPVGRAILFHEIFSIPLAASFLVYRRLLGEERHTFAEPRHHVHLRPRTNP
jgi:hypothetical protein